MVMDAFAKWKPFQEDLDKFPKVRRLYNQILPESDCSLFYTFDIKMKAEEPRLAYKSAKTNTDKLPSVFGDIILEQGKRYALCGGTGSGKHQHERRWSDDQICAKLVPVRVAHARVADNVMLICTGHGSHSVGHRPWGFLHCTELHVCVFSKCLRLARSNAHFCGFSVGPSSHGT